MRSTDSDRSVRATPKKARDASPPPTDDLWVVVKNPQPAICCSTDELATLSNAFALQQKTIADLEKINRDLEKVLSNMANPLRNTRFADAVKNGPPNQQLVERQPEFRKAGAAAWLALKRETFSPCTQCTESGALLGSPLIYASGFPYAKPGDLRKAMQGARIRT
ncbi:hypothetical protein BASA83_006077 [Batrachochytrium salamandrivorans]|nr:hypothetical protein BASA83_006077 [Batrachochytrium salamandrivorans]